MHSRSTLTAEVDLTEKISLDAEYSTLAIFIDIRKAFYTIDHDILLKKLKNMGIKGILLEWIQVIYKKDNI